MSDTKNNLAALAADVESALARRRSRTRFVIAPIVALYCIGASRQRKLLAAAPDATQEANR